MPEIYTTLNKIRSFSPCKSGWSNLLSHLNKTEADDEHVSYLTILESNGIEDTIWCMRAEWFENKELWMKFINSCVERVSNYSDANAANAAAAVYAAYAAAAAACTANAATDAANAAANAAAAAAVYVATDAVYATDAATDAVYATARLKERKLQAKSLKTLLIIETGNT